MTGDSRVTKVAARTSTASAAPLKKAFKPLETALKPLAKAKSARLLEKSVKPSENGARPLEKGKLVHAVVNAIKVLQYLSAAPAPATVTQITRDLRLNPSTCFNLLRTLIEQGLAHFEPVSKTYTLGLGIVALTRGALEQSVELQMLRPKLQALSRRHNVMAMVWYRINDDRIMLVAVAETEDPFRIHARVGTRSPLLHGASGRVFAAYEKFDKAELRQRFAALRFARQLDFETYLSQLHDVRQSGWAIDDGYAFQGTVTVAAPILEANAPSRYSCSAAMFNGQHDLQRIQTIAAELTAIGRTFLDLAPSASTAVRPGRS